MNRMIKLALLSVSLLVVSGGAIAGNIPAIAAAYLSVNEIFIELLSTMPSLFIILTIPISHHVAKRIGEKRTVQIGVLLVGLAGVLPVMTPSFGLLFFSCMLFGIGVGLLNPLLYSIAGQLYAGRELANTIGLQSAFEGIGGMLMTFSVGQLLQISWRVSFSVYLIALPIMLLFSIFVPNVPQKTEGQQVKNKDSLDRKTGYLFILLIISVTVYMSVAVKVTHLFLSKGIGDATAGSNLLALVGLGAMLAGIVFGPLAGKLKQYTIPFSFIGLAAAMFLLAFSTNLFAAFLAGILCGFSFRTFIPYLFNEINQTSKKPERDTSILLMAFNLGTAFAPISISFIQKILPFAHGVGLFVAEGCLMLILAVTTLGFKTVKKEVYEGK